MKEKGKSSLTVCMYSVQPRRRNLYERHRPQGYLDSKGRSSGRCPRSADRTTKLGLPSAWDVALGQRTARPNLVYLCLGRCARSADRSTELGLPVLGTVPSVSGPIDRTWSTGAWDGALDVLVPEPGRQLNPLNPVRARAVRA